MKHRGSGLIVFLLGYLIFLFGFAGLVLALTMNVSEQAVRAAVSIGDLLNSAKLLQSNPLMTPGNTVRLFLIQNRYLLLAAGAVLQALGAGMRKRGSR